MFLYVINHLVGYKEWTMDQLKGYGDAKENGNQAISHAHLKIDVSSIEVTTGHTGSPSG